MIKRLVVCGLGKLGLPIAARFSDVADLTVTGLDLDADRVAAINSGGQVGEVFLECPYSVCATTQADTAVTGSDACIFVTPTPSLPSGAFDNSFLLQAVETVAKAVVLRNPCDQPYLFIIASTVTPRTCDVIILPLLRKLCYGHPFHLVYKPEFIALGTVLRDLSEPDFHLIGQSSPEAGQLAAWLYSRITRAETPVKCMSLVEAELAKISLNCFVTMKISYANQIAMVAERLGADPEIILEAVGTDHRIGPATLKPGLPFGGPCFPRDSRMFGALAHEIGVPTPLADATDTVNRSVIENLAKKAMEHSGPVGILGLTYKPGTNVTDDSPGTIVRDLLLKWGRTVLTHDPCAVHSHSFEEVMDCSVILVTTAWPLYENLQFPPGVKVFIDPMRVVKTKTVTVQ